MRVILIEGKEESLIPVLTGLFQREQGWYGLSERLGHEAQGAHGHKELGVSPVQVNVFPPAGASDNEGKADTRHAELRSDIQAVKASVDGVGQAVVGVKRSNDDLQKMQAAGLFAFMTKVQQRDLQLFFAVLQHGDQSKAARALKMKDATFRERTRAWASMSRPYRVMHNLIAWRKGVSRKELVRFDDTLAQQIAQGDEREGSLRLVLEELAEMDSENWPEDRDDLETAITGDEE